MKKLLALVLSLVLMFSLVACGSNDTNTDDENKDSVVETKDDNESIELDVATKAFSRGEVDGDTYKSSFSGLEFTKPSDWVFSTDEELMALIDAGSEYTGVDSSDFEELVESGFAVYDAAAVSITGSSVMIGFENLETTSNEDATEAEYLDVMNQQLESVGYTMEDSESVKLGEKKYLKSVGTVSLSGVEFTQAYYVRKIGKYISFVIITLTDGTEVAEMEAMFS